MVTAFTDMNPNHTAGTAGVVVGLASRGPVLHAGMYRLPIRK